jgi:hypothetical protein
MHARERKRTLYANHACGFRSLDNAGASGQRRHWAQCLPESPRGEQLRVRPEVPVSWALQISRRQATLALLQARKLGGR